MHTSRVTTQKSRPVTKPLVTRTFQARPDDSRTVASYVSTGDLLQSIRPRNVRHVARHPLEQRVEWAEKEYRHAYLEESIEQGIAWQIKLNRKARGWSQAELAKMIGTQQSAISRLEDPCYGGHSLETLTSIAHAFDCALMVKLISYGQLAVESERLGELDQIAMSYEDEIGGEYVKEGE